MSLLLSVKLQAEYNVRFLSSAIPLLLSKGIITKHATDSFSLCPVAAFLSGYSPTVKGQLLHVDTTSSMQYRTLLEAEMLAVSVAHDVHHNSSLLIVLPTWSFSQNH